MKKDDHEIIKLYDNSSYLLLSKGMDFLNTENTTNYNWDLFEERYAYAKLHLNEKFEYEGEKDLGNSQKEFVYTITTPDNSTFHVKLNLYPNSMKMMDTSLLVSRSNGTVDHELYKKLLEKIKTNTNNFQLYISFFDSENNYKLTNKNKPSNESFVVFRSLENTLNHFIHVLNYKDSIDVVKFYVDINETRRIELYKRIASKVLNLNFENSLEDKLTDSRYILYTIF